jgi:3-methyladenine DNA glycosylase AlkD
MTVGGGVLPWSARSGQAIRKRTLSICAMLTADGDDMVVKAMSWALRELAKRDAVAVRRFLREHSVAPRVRREVTRKLETGRKEGDFVI